MADFIHLRSHSSYSICDGLASPVALVQKAKELGYPALALTDEANLFASRKFFEAAKEHAIKSLLGMDLFIMDDNGRYYRITALVKDKEGYENLIQLATCAQSENGSRRGAVPRSFFTRHKGGLLVLSGAMEGDVGEALTQNDSQLAADRLKWWLDLCGDDYYLELQRLGRVNEEVVNAETLILAQKYSCPPLATNDVRFLEQKDFDTHHLRVCIHHNQTIEDAEQTAYLDTQYLRSAEEMRQLFGDLPTVLENTVLAARRCNLLLGSESRLPIYPHKEGQDGASFLHDLAYEGIKGLLGEDWRQLRDGEYKKRLDRELKIIADMGYSDYFLIVADFVRWAKSKHIAVGPGRGSGTGSLVSYAISITTLDPLIHNLFFERFLNPGRASMPDFDIDVCMERRDEVIDYIRSTYGEESAVQIISFGTMGARAAVRDVTRVLNKPFGLGDKIARLIPEMPGATLAGALMEQPDLEALIEQDTEAKNIFNQAKKLEGTVRHTGSHAAGLVITSGEVANHCPLYEDDRNNLLTQLDKDDLEAQGLVKFDVLGLRTLTVIDHSLKMIKAYEGLELDMTKLSLEDEATFDLISRAQTYAVFQLESSGMRDVARRMRPKSFEDVVALLALFRPGPMELIGKFIANKQAVEKEKEIDYPHSDPKLQSILRPTYGIPVYQDQIMQMAQALAGFSLSQADVLRHAMGKKKKDVMKRQQQLFIAGAREQGYKEADAKNLFEMIESFAGYGFNRSHSVGYALLAYWTAYLKAHYPRYFLAAYMTSETNNHKKIARLVEEAQRLKISVSPPAINQSAAEFGCVKGSKTISFGLAAIKGVGRRAALSMVKERAAGNYKGFFDFCARMDDRILTRPLLENLVRAGVFHLLEPNQSLLMDNIERGMHHNKKTRDALVSAAGDMFASSLNQEIFVRDRSCRPWGASRKLKEEKVALGFCLKGDAFRIYKSEIRRYIQTTSADANSRKEMTFCGRIGHLRRILKPGSKDAAAFTLFDEKGSLLVRVGAESWGKKRYLLNEDQIIVVKGRLNTHADNSWLVARSIHGLEYLRVLHCSLMCLELSETHMSPQKLQLLKEGLEVFFHRAGLPLYLRLLAPSYDYTIRLFKSNHVVPSNDSIERIEEIFPEGKISLPLRSAESS